MLKLQASEYLELGETIERARNYFDLCQREKEKDPKKILDVQGVVGHLRELLGVCRSLDLNVSGDFICKYIDPDTVPKTKDAYSMLIECIYSELGTLKFFYIPPYKVGWYD